MKEKIPFIKRFPVILAITLFSITIALCWFMFREFNTSNVFYLSTVTYLVCVFLLVIGAEKYQKHKLATAILLGSASILLVLTMTDFYLITFCYETSGPCGENVITHRHWYNKFVHNNEYGFWERSLANLKNPSDRKDQLIIAVVGNSFTWGQGIEGRSERFTERLEKKLNEKYGGKKITVLNFGRGGADTRQQLQIVNDFVSKIHPDIVLICYLSNDINSNIVHRYSGHYNNWSEKLSTASPTLNYIYWHLVGPAKYRDIGLRYMQGLKASYDDPKLFQKHIAQLDELFQDVRQMGAQPIFVLMPFPHMWKLFPPSSRDEIYSRIKKSVTDAGVPLIDLSDIEEKFTPEEFQLNPFDAHPNARMHEKIAEEIYQGLIHTDAFTTELSKN